MSVPVLRYIGVSLYGVHHGHVRDGARVLSLYCFSCWGIACEADCEVPSSSRI